ncbi:HEAT repeat domain-containing protein [Aerolutibacter ruishenii]|uniref:HEAT repeat protein n=1 Tax=Aerolutibacter ruishenii TaxID=686800 RepID=A0A562M180_9GAMM|nr:HEAT repeat domain-containing protein [Lysobacter ruishenii]TWI13613.1 HEAT repeat protein [Lysobacter ruishenii]
MDLGFLSGADSKLVFAFWLGVTVLVMTLVTLTVILVMRQMVARKERAHLRAAHHWGRILVDVAHGGEAGPSTLPARDVSGFVEAWNGIHANLGGAENPALQALAGSIGLEKRLHSLLQRGGFHERVVTIIALGYLRSRAHFDRIARLLDDRSSIVSLCAARAIMQIDPGRAVSLLVPQIMARGDWSQGGVADILREAGAGRVSQELGTAALQANADVAPRMVRFLAGVSPEAAAPVIRQIVATSNDDHLVSTCLQVLADPADLDLVRPLLDHPRWHVRMHAATALGRLGVPGDEQRLLPLLADAQWWVRYRAAQALVKLPFMKEAAMHRFRDTQTDRFACDILDQVMAEQRMGVER